MIIIAVKIKTALSIRITKEGTGVKVSNDSV